MLARSFSFDLKFLVARWEWKLGLRHCVKVKFSLPMNQDQPEPTDSTHTPLSTFCIGSWLGNCSVLQPNWREHNKCNSNDHTQVQKKLLESHTVCIWIGMGVWKLVLYSVLKQRLFNLLEGQILPDLAHLPLNPQSPNLTRKPHLVFRRHPPNHSWHTHKFHSFPRQGPHDFERLVQVSWMLYGTIHPGLAYLPLNPQTWQEGPILSFFDILQIILGSCNTSLFKDLMILSIRSQSPLWIHSMVCCWWKLIFMMLQSIEMTFAASQRSYSNIFWFDNKNLV